MLSFLKKNMKMGFGKTEVTKTSKGVAVGGIGAVAYTIISDIGYMPETLTSPDIVPYVVAGLSSAINAIRHFFKNNMS